MFQLDVLISICSDLKVTVFINLDINLFFFLLFTVPYKHHKTRITFYWIFFMENKSRERTTLLYVTLINIYNIIFQTDLQDLQFDCLRNH